MKKWQLYIVLMLATALLTGILYEPCSLFIYRVKEPYFKCPIDTNVVVRNDSRGDGDFGAKRKNGRSHSGIDMLAPLGTPVHASKSGIAFRGNVPTGYGKYVMIYHPDGYETIYGHLSEWNIISAKKVRQGELIGFVGKTGNASHKFIQPHLHFEIRKEEKSIDPRGLMR